jgi:hypothetical protein
MRIETILLLLQVILNAVCDIAVLYFSLILHEEPPFTRHVVWLQFVYFYQP